MSLYAKSRNSYFIGFQEIPQKYLKLMKNNLKLVNLGLRPADARTLPRNILLFCFSFFLPTEYISSPTATMFPIKELIELCKSKNVITLVDGAHSPGQVPLDVENMGCDYYSG